MFTSPWMFPFPHWLTLVPVHSFNLKTTCALSIALSPFFSFISGFSGAALPVSLASLPRNSLPGCLTPLGHLHYHQRTTFQAYEDCTSPCLFPDLKRNSMTSSSFSSPINSFIFLFFPFFPWPLLPSLHSLFYPPYSLQRRLGLQDINTWHLQSCSFDLSIYSRAPSYSTTSSDVSPKLMAFLMIGKEFIKLLCEWTSYTPG